MWAPAASWYIVCFMTGEVTFAQRLPLPSGGPLGASRPKSCLVTEISSSKQSAVGVYPDSKLCHVTKISPLDCSMVPSYYERVPYWVPMVFPPTLDSLYLICTKAVEGSHAASLFCRAFVTHLASWSE